MIPQIQPWIDEEELKEVVEAISSTWVTEHDKYKEFTEKLKELTKVKYVLVVDHGTNALYLSLLSMGIGPGDEVLVPDITFVASCNAVLRVGATPVLVDVDEESFINIDLDQAEKKITSKTKAIMPIHLYGQATDMDKVMKLARKHNLKVIEDAAQAIGVTFKGRQLGTIGDIGIFSFYGNKTITTGEGGAVLTNKTRLYQVAEQWAHEGRSKGSFVCNKLGYNFHMTEVQAAIGLAQLDKLPKIIKRKRLIRQMYYRSLSPISDIKFPTESKDIFYTYWFTNIFVKNAAKLEKYLKTNDVQTRRIFYPLHLQPCYKNILKTQDKYPRAEESYRRGLSLPSSAILEDKEIQKVCDLVIKYFSKRG